MPDNLHMPGTLYLIPAPLGGDDASSIPSVVTEAINTLDHFLVEQEKTARRHLKRMGYTHSLDKLELFRLDKNTQQDELMELLLLLLNGTSLGLISEAGLPCVADPGALMVRIAHENKVPVIPLPGSSSILLALAASGMNGQSFSFHGYLPIKQPARRQAIQQVERQIRQGAQIFMETPYRNNQLIKDLIDTCKPNTRLCVAANLTLPQQKVVCQTIAEWKRAKHDFHKQPAIFILGVN